MAFAATATTCRGIAWYREWRYMVNIGPNPLSPQEESMARQLSVSQAARSLVSSRHMSSEVAQKLSQRDEAMPVSDVELGFDDPVLAVFVIDASPSMKPFVQAVIDGQHIAINTLRDSAKCDKGALWVAQILFSTKVTLLNSFVKLDQAGNDVVPLLDEKTYRPDDGEKTALYATVLGVFQRIAVHIADGLTKNVRSTATIAVITDGEDNVGGVDPGDIRAILNEMKANGHILRSTVIGIASKDLPPERITQIKETLGFDESFSVEQSARDIRRAFALASESSVSAQQRSY